jgi:hypothetical protein
MHRNAENGREYLKASRVETFITSHQPDQQRGFRSVLEKAMTPLRQDAPHRKRRFSRREAVESAYSELVSVAFRSSRCGDTVE